MEQKFKTFVENDKGAVTVDWIVLAAAVVGLGLYGLGSLQQGISNLVLAVEAGVSIPNDD